MSLGGYAVEPKAAYWAWIRICFVVAAFVEWGQQRKRLNSLARRMEPTITIRELQSREWPVRRMGFTGKEFYFEVFNESHVQSLENVRAELIDISPLEIKYLPVPLHVKHDRTYERTEFTVNPRSGRHVDLITGPTDKEGSQAVMIIAHTVNNEREPIPNTKYLLTVRVSANNTPPSVAQFQAWIANGELACIHLP